MNRRIIKKVNGGIAIYYGIGAILGAIVVLIGFGNWLYMVFSDQTDFSWGILIGLATMTVVLGFIGSAILRVGYEELEE